MKYSVTSYSFHQKISAGKMTQLDCIAAARDMGFDGIEFTDLIPCKNPTQPQQLAYAERLRREAERVGIAIVSYSIGANLYRPDPQEAAAEVARLCGQVDVAAAMGAPVMRHDATAWTGTDKRVRSFDSMLPVIAENARKVTEYAATRGVRTCTENHGFVCQDSDRVERLYNAVDHENYGVLVDIGNFACVDESSVQAVSRLAPYAVHVHAKDFVVYPFGANRPDGVIVTRGANGLQGCVIGEGDIPVAQCVAILRRAGYDGYITAEYEGREDCLAALPRALTNLRRM